LFLIEQYCSRLCLDCGFFIFNKKWSLLQPFKFGRSREMKYLKAENVLPEEVIELIQRYIDGEFVYIPRKIGKKRAWGEKSGARKDLKERNSRIYKKYMDGATIEELSRDCFLSEQSIRRIISQEKLLFSNSIYNCL
jgi:hypothetical protein